MNKIRFFLTKNEIQTISDFIWEKTDKVRHLCPEGSGSQIYIIPAVETPDDVEARIELFIRRSYITPGEFKVYSHLNIHRKNGYSIAKILYPSDLTKNMLDEIQPSQNIPYHVIFERKI